MIRTKLPMLFTAGLAIAATHCSQSGPAADGTSAAGGVLNIATGGGPGAGGSNNVGGSTSSTGNGGTTDTSIGGSVDTGGSTSGTLDTGGTPSTGGSGADINTGGTISSAGGGVSTGGKTSVGGGIGTGGTIGLGGSTGNTGGKVGATGGVVGSTGGATSTGGKANATGGTVSATGGTVSATGGKVSTGGSTGSTTLDPSTIVPTLDGYMWIASCSNGSQTGLDCPLYPAGTTTCPNATSTDFTKQGMFRTVTHTVGGTPGTQYTLNFEVRGILGGKCYTGGTMRTPTLSTNPETSNDGWYTGGQPVVSKWNTYEVHVTPAVGTTNINPLNTAENIYFLNAMPYPAIAYGLDTYCEAHETFPFRYTASFPVMGGGTISLTIHDSNCLGQMNCGGPNRQTICANPRTMDLTGMAPAPVGFTQPNVQTNGFHPQWVMFDVKTVTSP